MVHRSKKAKQQKRKQFKKRFCDKGTEPLPCFRGSGSINTCAVCLTKSVGRTRRYQKEDTINRIRN